MSPERGLQSAKIPLDYNDPEMAQDATDVLNAFSPQIEDSSLGLAMRIETVGRLHLVTGDKEMRKASTAVGLVQYIHSLDEYLALIGL